MRQRESMQVKLTQGFGMTGAAAIAALSVLLAPAFAAQTPVAKAKKRPAISFGGGSLGTFTPSVADPRLAAAFARRAIQTDSFRFTPSSGVDKTKSVKVAIRARAATPGQAVRVADASDAITAITPTAYNLGVAVGWKRFALSGDVAKVEGGVIASRREAAEVGLSYSGKRFTGGVQVGAERAELTQARILPSERSYSLDVGGSYSLARNLSVTGGVRYKIQRDRLAPLEDERRDSQAVYIGTAFRF